MPLAEAWAPPALLDRDTADRAKAAQAKPPPARMSKDVSRYDKHPDDEAFEANAFEDDLRQGEDEAPRPMVLMAADYPAFA